MFSAYMLRCADGSYYIRHTDDLGGRIAQHRTGAIPGYTSKRLPVMLVWSQGFPMREEALAAQRQIKGWTRTRKEALTVGDWDAIRNAARKPRFDTTLRQAQRLLRANGMLWGRR